MFIDDLRQNWCTVNSHENWSVVSDVSLNTLQMVTLNIYKNSTDKSGRKTGFKIENEIEDQDQSIPKLTVILAELRCIFGQNLEILTSTCGEYRADKLKIV